MSSLKSVVATMKKLKYIVFSSARTASRPHPDEDDMFQFFINKVYNLKVVSIYLLM